MAETKPAFNLTDWLVNAALRGIIGAALLLPYAMRVRASGWLFSRILSPLAGYHRRIRDNLAMIVPDMPADEVARLMRAVPDNVGRTLIEIYSGAEFIKHVTSTALSGPGLAALDAAHAANRPVILVTGHFGNYDASRAALIARGYPVGALYNPMSNRYFNSHYVNAMASIGTPLFARGKPGLAGMVKFLRGGGMLGLLIDQRMHKGEKLSFFGHDALTALSAATLALKYDALVVPTYGVRRDNGLDFDIIIEAPIPHGPPEAMTQALNDSLEAIVRQHMDQWFWIHRRWKG